MVQITYRAFTVSPIQVSRHLLNQLCSQRIQLHPSRSGDCDPTAVHRDQILGCSAASHRRRHGRSHLPKHGVGRYDPNRTQHRIRVHYISDNRVFSGRPKVTSSLQHIRRRNTIPCAIFWPSEVKITAK